MSVFKVEKTKEAINESTGNSFIGKSGIYDITIDCVSIKSNPDNKAMSLNFNVDYNGNKQTLYDLKLFNKDGSKNFQYSVFNNLMIIAGLTETSEPQKETHRVGKDNKEIELDVIPDFTGMPVKVKVQNQYQYYNGNITESKVIRKFYRYEDGATASEIVASENGLDVKFGTQYSKDLPNADKDSYVRNNGTNEDMPTEEEVEVFKASKSNSNGKTSSTTPLPKSTSKNPFA